MALASSLGCTIQDIVVLVSELEARHYSQDAVLC